MVASELIPSLSRAYPDGNSPTIAADSGGQGGRAARRSSWALVAAILKLLSVKRMRGEEPGSGRMAIEQELTRHLERASELSERAKRANDAVQRQVDPHL